MKTIIGILTFVLIITTSMISKDTKSDKQIIIDVRTEQEYNQANIPGSVLIPYDIIHEKIEEIVPDKETKIVLYCRSGRRSGIADKVLKDMGYKNAENYGSLERAKVKLGIDTLK